MRPLNIKEFAQQLRMEGNEFADEILDLAELEDEVAQPYSDLCDDLNHYAPDVKGKPAKQVEWLGDRSHLLDDITEELAKANRTGDVDDEVKELIETLENFEGIMRRHGGWTEGDLQDALFALIERADKVQPEYDL